MDSEQPSAKKKQPQKGDKGSPAISKKSTKQQKSSKKTRKDGRAAEQGPGSKDMTDTDLSDTTNVPPPAKKQRKDKKGQGSETKQSKKSHTDVEVEGVRVRIKREEGLEEEDVASLLHSAPEGQLIKMDKVTSLW
jgi:hypothetical protein